jgi:hypothetical protein
LIIADPDIFPGLRHLLNLALDIYPIFGERRYYSPEQVIEMANRVGFRKKDLLKSAFSYILIFEKC